MQSDVKVLVENAVDIVKEKRKFTYIYEVWEGDNGGF